MIINYCIKKFRDYFLSKIDPKLEKEAYCILSYEERKIYDSMPYYDKYHGLVVYSSLKKITNDKNYLKFSILHDCGKGKASFFLRVLHKLRFKTKLRFHTINGYEMLKDINYDVADLIKRHHNKNTKGLMKKFQEIDDRS